MHYVLSHSKASIHWLLLVIWLLNPVTGYTQEWSFDTRTQKAYNKVLNLQLEEAHQLIPNPITTEENYVIALAEALELVFTEDAEKYTTFEQHFEQRLTRKSKLNNPNELFLQAELYLQWTFVYLKFGHELDAAQNIRQAYLISQDVKKRFPSYKAIKKTSGVLNVIIGSIPEKYNWVLNLLNMHGSVKSGLDELEAIRSSEHPLSFEAQLLYCFTQGFVLQQPDKASAALNQFFNTEEHPHDNSAKNYQNPLALFLGASLHMKNSSSEKALYLLNRLTEQQTNIPLYYVDYLKGEIFLHKADYISSISHYQSFISNYAGQNHLKDSYYKIGMCHWLSGHKNEALALFNKARNVGKEATEADKYAARSLAETELPHVALTKARYYTDGGYYNDAKKILEDLNPPDLVTKKDQVEYHYRKARVAQKIMDFSSAKTFYNYTIEGSGTAHWYFAPNACLQLGYIAVQENDLTAARIYFNKALGYKKHVYKNSIDSKARSALAQINTKSN